MSPQCSTSPTDRRFVRDFNLTSKEDSPYGQFKTFFNNKIAYFFTKTKPSSDADDSESNRNDELKKDRVKFEVPIYPNQSDLKLRAFFNYKYPLDSDCTVNTPIPLTQKTILTNSSIDVSHVSHFIEMPNLSVFAQKGFPFTRMADLSDTGVVFNKNFAKTVSQPI
jgi:hypothetical protein